MKRIIIKLKLFSIACFDKWEELVLDLFTLIGSAVTIAYTYFKSGFVLNDYWDLAVLGFILFIFAVWAYRAYKTIFQWDSLDLPKETFFEYLPLQLEKASTDIKSLAGDVSWLEKQKEVYSNLLSQNPHMTFSIYYSDKESELRKRTRELITDYCDIGVKMIPYPYEVETEHIKGVLIDPNEENARFLSFSKKKDGDIINCTKYFSWTNEFHLANTFVNSINTYVSLIAEVNEMEEEYTSKIEELEKNNSKYIKKLEEKKCVYVGVSGLNNIGKSTLCDVLKRYYQDRVIIVRDPFISDIKNSSFDIALFCLLNQILEFQEKYQEIEDGTIFVFDRTPIDNYAFLKSYKTSSIYDRYIERLENAIHNFMNSFNLIVLLTPEDDYRFEKTSQLNADYRKTLSERILKLYERIHLTNLQTYVITYAKKGYKRKIQEIVKDIAKHIDALKEPV